MMSTPTGTSIPSEFAGWWRITETETWSSKSLDMLGSALISFTGYEYDQMSGTGSASLGKDGRLRGRIKINDGDSSTFMAERTTAPKSPIPDPPSYRDKWRR